MSHPPTTPHPPTASSAPDESPHPPPHGGRRRMLLIAAAAVLALAAGVLVLRPADSSTDKPDDTECPTVSVAPFAVPTPTGMVRVRPPWSDVDGAFDVRFNPPLPEDERNTKWEDFNIDVGVVTDGAFACATLPEIARKIDQDDSLTRDQAIEYAVDTRRETVGDRPVLRAWLQPPLGSFFDGYYAELRSYFVLTNQGQVVEITCEISAEYKDLFTQACEETLEQLTITD